MMMMVIPECIPPTQLNKHDYMTQQLNKGGGESAEVWGLGVVIYYVLSKKMKIKNRLSAKHPLYLW